MRFIFGFSVVLFGLVAHAQSVPLLPLCEPQIKSLCAVKEGKPLVEAREIFACLKKYEAALAPSCKSEIERYVQNSRQASARGGGALGSFGGMTSLTPPIPIVSYEGRYAPKGPAFSENRLSFSSPVYGSETGITSAAFSAGELHVNEQVVMTNGTTLPVDLYRVEIGAQYSRRLSGKKSLGLRASVGSTGDQVFQAARDANFSLSGTYGFPGSGPDYWVALVLISNNSTIGDYIPIPGVLYIHRTDHFTGIFGFPVLSLQWTPTSAESYAASVFGTNVVVEAAHGEVDRIQFFVQGAFSQQKYILHDRQTERDRLTLQEKKVLVGLRTALFQAAYGEFQLGRAFDRSFYVGEKIFNSDHGLADLESSAFLNVNIKYVF